MNRFTLYEQRRLNTRRVNRRISIVMGIAALAACVGLMWLTSIPGAP